MDMEKRCGEKYNNEPTTCNYILDYYYENAFEYDFDESGIVETVKSFDNTDLNILACNERLKSTEPEDICKEIISNLPSNEWFLDQRDYFTSLSQHDKVILSYYGSNSGANTINSYLISGVQGSIPEEIGLSFDSLIKRLQLLIECAPPLDKDIIVYRGEKTSEHIPITKSSTYSYPNFVSTSLSPKIGYLYSEEETGSLTKITIPKGTHVVYISPYASDGYAEDEIVLNRGTSITIVEDQYVYPYCIEDVDEYDEEKVFYRLVHLKTNIVKVMNI